MDLSICVVVVVMVLAEVSAQPRDVSPTRYPRTSGGPAGRPKWRPRSGTAEEFMKYHGMGREKAAKQKEAVQDIKKMVSRKYNRDIDGSSQNEFFGDVLPTMEQLEIFKEGFQKGQGHRVKRKITNFEKFSTNKWPSPIPYAFDGNQSENDVATVRQSIRVWEERTCIRFVEVADTTTFIDQYLLFTNDGNGCYSYVGRTTQTPQIINLQSPGCTGLVGVAIHEIGHALGFNHEHIREDRDQYVDIAIQNVKPGFEVNFERRPDGHVVDLGVPYDYSSVMHYDPKAFSTDANSLNTIVPLDPSKLNVIGQRTDLSFLDAKLANIAYCSDSCSGSSLQCQNGGYPDPNDNCAKCVCPEGYGGTLCDGLQDSDPVCDTDGTPLVAAAAEVCLESPGYAFKRVEAGTQCNWQVEAPAGCTIDFRFTNLFLTCNTRGTCLKRVDIIDRSGANSKRFCCYTAPTEVHTSKENQAIVTLRTDYFETNSTSFKLCYKLTDPSCDDPAPSVTPPTTTSTKPPTTTSTKPPTTTSTKPPTTTSTKPPTTTSTKPTTTTSTKPPTTPSTKPTTTPSTKPPTTKPSTRPTTTTGSSVPPRPVTSYNRRLRPSRRPPIRRITRRILPTRPPYTRPPTTTLVPGTTDQYQVCRTWNWWRDRTNYRMCATYWWEALSRRFRG